MNFNVREEIIAMTPQWKGERLPDGRPHVPTLIGEDTKVAGYASQGRLFAIGYLKGLLHATEN